MFSSVFLPMTEAAVTCVQYLLIVGLVGSQHYSCALLPVWLHHCSLDSERVNPLSCLGPAARMWRKHSNAACQHQLLCPDLSTAGMNSQEAAVRLVHSPSSRARSFATLSPQWWKDLPTDIRTAQSLTTFRRLLKTHLFRQHL
ncbi:UNVERIFIED_CONTAM: hypothetical protein FKN15_018437 [Acipenser sinensis]